MDVFISMNHSWKTGTTGMSYVVICNQISREDLETYDDARRLAKEWSGTYGMSARIYEVRSTHVHTEDPASD